MRSTVFRFVLLIALVVSLLPTSALAAAPPTTPQVIKTVGFENTTTDSATLNMVQYAGDDPTTAYWGPVTGSKRTGSYGLWAAGKLANGTAKAYGIYPELTRGQAFVDVPDLANYYSSNLSFYYTMPSIGGADATSFSVSWLNSNNTAIQVGNEWFGKTSQGQWLPWNGNLTAAANSLNLSRVAGRVRFQFFDHIEASSVTAKTGYGPTIDDVSITGFKYGPPRSLVATEDAQKDIRLTWAAPQRAINDSAADSRAVAYRVWRAVDGQLPLSWTELTTSASRLLTTTYTDTTAVQGTTYRYAVQTWDQGTGAGYSTPSEAVGRVRLPDLDVSAQAPQLVSKDTTFSVTYTVVSDTARTGIIVSDGRGFSQSVSLPTGGSQQLPRSMKLSQDATIVVTAAHAATGKSATDTRTIDVREPKVTLSLTPEAAGRNPDGTLPVVYTVTNTGDTELNNLVVTDGLGSDPLAAIGVLAAGANYSFEKSQMPGEITGHVQGSYGSQGSEFFGTVRGDSTITVTPATAVVKLTPSTTAPRLGAYGVSIKLTARVTDAKGNLVPVGGVALQEYIGGWQTVATAASTSYTFSRVIKKSTKFRAVLTGAPAYALSVSPYVAIVPYAYLTTPSRPAVYRNRTFTSYGYIGPKHPAKVKVIAERLEKGRWVPRTYAYASLSAKSSGYNKYTARLTIRYPGYWRLRAYHAGDAWHRTTYSSPTRTFRVN